jgi:hypothetical protein
MLLVNKIISSLMLELQPAKRLFGMEKMTFRYSSSLGTNEANC